MKSIQALEKEYYQHGEDRRSEESAEVIRARRRCGEDRTGQERGEEEKAHLNIEPILLILVSFGRI